MNSKELGFKSELEELRAMEPKVQRKSWFCASPTFVRIKPPGPLDPIGESGFMKSQMTADERDLEVILASNENEVPTTVVASDILTLTTFSRRAVIDFGVVSITGRPIKRYLLLENPHEEDQTVVIQCGLPSNEFSLDWVGSKSTRSQQRIPLSGCSVTLDDPNVTVVRANQGRSLLQVTWIPSASGGSVGFHHTVKFHVNGAYPLQAWVIGRFCVPPSEKVSRFKNPKRVLQGQATMLSSAHTPIGLPSWTNTSFHRVNTLTTQSRHAGAHVSNSSVKTSAFSSALTANNSVPNSALKQRSLSHDRVLNPIHSVHKNLVDFDLREQWQSQIDMPCLLSTQNLEEQLVALERQKALLSSALTFQRIQSTSDLHVQCKISAPSTTQPTSHGFAPPGPSSQRPKRTVPRSNDWSELDQFTRTTLRRSSSVGGLNTSFSRREVPQPSSNTDLTLINATAIGFLSPQLVRSPVLRGDPVLLTTESVKQKTTTVTHESNLFHPDFSHTLSEVSEHGLTQWLNSVFAPCITANAAVCHTHATNNYLTDVCTPGTSTYLVAVSRAVHLLRSSTIVGPGQRVEREVDEGKIIPTVDLSFSADKGAQRRLLDQIIANYAPVWLHLAVDALSSTTIHTQIQQENDLEATGPCVTLPNRATGPTVPLSKKLHFYVFKVTVGGKTLGSAREKTYSTTKNTQEAVKSRGIQPTLKPARKLSRELIHNRFVVKRFLILVWFLDRLKSNRLIKYDPCLFREKSHIKSSSESLLQFARNFLTGENNLVRHLATLGARVEIVQTPLDEYRLTVTNLAVDLRDGIRLVKLAELLIPTLPQNDSMKRRLSSNRTDVSNLMSLVRFPAISRLQKIHNVGLALKAFEESGRVCMPDGSRIDPRDIVDGHHEKCLTLLWCLLLRYQVLALVDEALLDGEIALLKGEIASNDSDRIAHRIREIERAKESVPVHTKLLHWAALVGHIYGLQISNLDESFADGRALCFLVHHYLPTVIPKGLIRQLTTSTVVDKFCSHIPAEQLARNNRYNLLLFERKLSFLGDMPVLLSPTPLRDLPHILPPGLVLATLAYLASRLVLVSKARQQLVDLVRDHAARILQGAWRRLQHRRELEQMRWLSPSKGKQFKTPYLSEKAKKSIFGTPTSPAMQQFFNSRPSRPPASISPVTNSEDSRIQAVVCLQAAVRGFLTRRRLQADLLLASRDRAATCIQRAFRLHREKNKVDRALTYHQAATQIQRQWRKYAIWRRRQHEASASSFVLDLQSHCRGYCARQEAGRQLDLALVRDRAASCIQSHWRAHKVRCEFLQTRTSVVKIQSWWRGVHERRRYLAMRKFVLDLQSHCRGYCARQEAGRQLDLALVRDRAASCIQSHWRAHKVRCEFLQTRTSVVKIQSWWRGVHERRRYLAMRKFVLDLQSHCRGYCARQEAGRQLDLALVRDRAASCIQSHWRAHKVRCEFLQTRTSVVKIQSWWRGVHERRRYLAMRKFVLDLQSHCRGYCARQEAGRQLDLALVRDRAASCIQSHWRAHKVRCEFLQTRTSVVKIQSWWRGVHERRRYLAMRKFVLDLQSHCRGYCARQEAGRQLDLALVRDRAASCIQSHWRAHKVRCEFLQTRTSVVKIQSWWRGVHERRRYLAMRKFVLDLQSHCRGYCARQEAGRQLDLALVRDRAASCIQSHWRAHKVRCEFLQTRTSVVKIQSWWRGVHERRRYLAMRKFVLDLQSHCRGYCARQEAGRQLDLALVRDRAASCIQSHWRAHKVRCEFLQTRTSVVKIQSWWRGVHERRRYLAMRKFVLDLQSHCRGYCARQEAGRQLDLALVRDRAASCIQSHWRAHKVRCEFLQTRTSVVKIQSWWRGVHERRRYLAMRKFVLDLQSHCRGYCARQEAGRQLDLALVRDRAASCIQSHWRAHKVRCEFLQTRTSVVKIQSWWRGVHERRRYLAMRKAVIRIQRAWRLSLLRRDQAASRIQRWWRVGCHVSRQLARDNRAATRIQSVWRGILTRRRVAQLALTKQEPIRSSGAGRVSFSRSHMMHLDWIDPIVARRLIVVRGRLLKASNTALRGQHLASRARSAVECILRSKSVSQVFDAIKCLELCTRLSREVSYWSVNISLSKVNVNSTLTLTNGPCIHLIFLHLIQSCNRSIPHEDILLSVAGTLLNIVRHRPLAECVQLWWTVPSIGPGSADPSRWVSPALLDRTRPRLGRSESLVRVNSAGEDSSIHSRVGVTERVARKRDSSIGALRGLEPIQTSMVEALVGILLRTCRARPGTPGVRLFARVCCVLSILCSSLPTQLVPTGSLIPVCEQLSDCLARRAPDFGYRHLHLNSSHERSINTRPHSELLREQVENVNQRGFLRTYLRKLLSCELDWHLYPIKTRPDPLVAVDYLLLTLLSKVYES